MKFAKIAFISCFLLMFVGFYSMKSFAQNSQGLNTFYQTSVDENNVDLISGFSSFQLQDLSIGSDQSGLSHMISSVPNGFPLSWGFTDQYMGGIRQAGLDDIGPVCYPAKIVEIGGSSKIFCGDDNNGYTDYKRSGDNLAKYGANEYRYTDKKGTIYTFSPGYSIHGFYSLVMRRILSVNGEEVNISFDSSNRIRSVTHNAGYQLRYEYQYSGNTYFPTRITAVNMAVDYCDPNATSCTYSRPWRFVTYNWYISPSEQRLTVTDGGGQITRYTMDKWWRVIRVKPANADVDTIEYKYCQHDVPGGSEPITCADDPNDTMSATGRWAGRAVVYDKVYLVVRNGKNWNYSFDAYSFTSSFTAQDFRMSSEVGRSKFVRIHFSISGDVLIQQITDSDKNYAFMGGEKIGLKPLFSQTNLMSSNFMITEATSFACGNIKMAFLM